MLKIFLIKNKIPKKRENYFEKNKKKFNSFNQINFKKKNIYFNCMAVEFALFQLLVCLHIKLIFLFRKSLNALLCLYFFLQ